MKTVYQTNRFEKDLKQVKKRDKDLGKLRAVVRRLAKGERLPRRYRDHKLKGQYEGTRECHLESDWLLVYEHTDTELFLVRTGSHADLFE